MYYSEYANAININLAIYSDLGLVGNRQRVQSLSAIEQFFTLC